jgi:hypothetical protein
MANRIKVSVSLALLLSGIASLQAVQTRAQKVLREELQQYQTLANEALESRPQDTPLAVKARIDALNTCVISLQVREQQLEEKDSSMLEQFRALRITCQDKIKELIEDKMYQ